MGIEMVRTGFTAAEHGFKFLNSFAFAESVSLNSISRQNVFLNDLVIGLCGGMCFAALDYFNAHIPDNPIPTETQVNAIPARLRQYLLGRQLDSLAHGGVLKVLSWTTRKDDSLAMSVAGWEVPKLRRQLSHVGPAVLALIRVRKISQLMWNHQVLATGYDFNEDTKDMVVYLYDPNWPRKMPTLKLNVAKPSTGIALTQSTGEDLRGFFVIGYGAKKPPKLN